MPQPQIILKAPVETEVLDSEGVVAYVNQAVTTWDQHHDAAETMAAIREQPADKAAFSMLFRAATPETGRYLSVLSHILDSGGANHPELVGEIRHRAIALALHEPKEPYRGWEERKLALQFLTRHFGQPIHAVETQPKVPEFVPNGAELSRILKMDSSLAGKIFAELPQQGNRLLLESLSRRSKNPDPKVIAIDTPEKIVLTRDETGAPVTLPPEAYWDRIKELTIYMMMNNHRLPYPQAGPAMRDALDNELSKIEAGITAPSPSAETTERVNRFLTVTQYWGRLLPEGAEVRPENPPKTGEDRIHKIIQAFKSTPPGSPNWNTLQSVLTRIGEITGSPEIPEVYVDKMNSDERLKIWPVLHRDMLVLLSALPPSRQQGLRDQINQTVRAHIQPVSAEGLTFREKVKGFLTNTGLPFYPGGRFDVMSRPHDVALEVMVGMANAPFHDYTLAEDWHQKMLRQLDADLANPAVSATDYEASLKEIAYVEGERDVEMGSGGFESSDAATPKMQQVLLNNAGGYKSLADQAQRLLDGPDPNQQAKAAKTFDILFQLNPQGEEAFVDMFNTVEIPKRFSNLLPALKTGLSGPRLAATTKLWDLIIQHTKYMDQQDPAIDAAEAHLNDMHQAIRSRLEDKQHPISHEEHEAFLPHLEKWWRDFALPKIYNTDHPTQARSLIGSLFPLYQTRLAEETWPTAKPLAETFGGVLERCDGRNAGETDEAYATWTAAQLEKAPPEDHAALYQLLGRFHSGGEAFAQIVQKGLSNPATPPETVKHLTKMMTGSVLRQFLESKKSQQDRFLQYAQTGFATPRHRAESGLTPLETTFIDLLHSPADGSPYARNARMATECLTETLALAANPKMFTLPGFSYNEHSECNKALIDSLGMSPDWIPKRPSDNVSFPYRALHAAEFQIGFGPFQKIITHQGMMSLSRAVLLAPGLEEAAAENPDCAKLPEPTQYARQILALYRLHAHLNQKPYLPVKAVQKARHAFQQTPIPVNRIYGRNVPAKIRSLLDDKALAQNPALLKQELMAQLESMGADKAALKDASRTLGYRLKGLNKSLAALEEERQVMVDGQLAPDSLAQENALKERHTAFSADQTALDTALEIIGPSDDTHPDIPLAHLLNDPEYSWSTTVSNLKSLQPLLEKITEIKAKTPKEKAEKLELLLKTLDKFPDLTELFPQLNPALPEKFSPFKTLNAFTPEHAEWIETHLADWESQVGRALLEQHPGNVRARLAVVDHFFGVSRAAQIVPPALRRQITNQEKRMEPLNFTLDPNNPDQ